MFRVYLKHGNRISQHFTNCVQSKLDGNLLYFRDRDEIDFNVDPESAVILLNLNPQTKLPELPIFCELKTLDIAEKEKLTNFQVQYHGSLTSADLQSFMLGLHAGEKIIQENPYL